MSTSTIAPITSDAPETPLHAASIAVVKPTPSSIETFSAEAVAENSRFSDYMALIKPRLSAMALITVAVGYALGSAGSWSLIQLFHVLLGVGLAAVASSALNQFLERDSDLHMERTANRPLPSGRMRAGEVFLIGMACAFASVLYLTVFVNPLTAALALSTIVLYVYLYTPLKRVSSLCTVIGAISGAVPPVLGWTGAGQPLNSGAFVLFSILFLWQFPHFLAIAWLYQKQYANAGLRMLPMGTPQKGVTGFIAVGYALILLPVSLLPVQFQMAGPLYFAVAFSLSLLYLLFSVQFMLSESRKTARQLLYFSLLYLPFILIALMWNHLQLMMG